MNAGDAIKEIKRWTGILMNAGSQCVMETAESQEMAISALERQIPKKIDFEQNLGDCTSRFICECGKRIIARHDSGVMDNHDAPNYCPNCGQRLDWSE